MSIASTRLFPTGDLLRRAELNFQRLHDPEFHFDATMRCSTAREAPGDWVGRSLLGLTLLGDLLGRLPPHRDEILQRLPEALNPGGYIGEVGLEGTVDESQLAGHNALLCGLAEVFRADANERARAIARGIVNGLFLPAEALFAEYPDQPPPALSDGSQIGLTVPQQGVWRGLSTDIGAVFMSLDGLTRWHEVDPDPGLARLIGVMIGRCAELDPVAMGAQTHSTLSGLRGVLRWHRATKDRALLELVLARESAYRRHARTEHHANHNWFGRPAWTEACAIVDAFLLALDLWDLTRDVTFLDEAHMVYHNALVYAQRPNGGFGCDCCLGAAGRAALEPHEFYEAPWCCTMRGAEGLTHAAMRAVHAGGTTIDVRLHHAGELQLAIAGGGARVRVESGFPREAWTRWTVLESSVGADTTWRVFEPPGVSGSALRRNGALVAESVGRFATATAPLREGDHWAWSGQCGLRMESLLDPSGWSGWTRLAHGPLLLGVESEFANANCGAPDDWLSEGSACYRHRTDGRLLRPLDDVTFRPVSEARNHRSRLIFQK